MFVKVAHNVLRLCEVGDFHHKTSIEALNRHFCKTAVGSWCSVFRVCKPLIMLSLSVIIFVVLVCAVAYFLFSEGEEIFFNSILSGLERWKLFCKLWPVLGLVRLANVLAPVRWLIVFLNVVISPVK